ncbi:molybdopterin-guanine dinucleotide biosynthesis protein MobB [Lonsdalea populi]|uniref:Molybdopterin-guanine dinucleotide biosynthesis protein B n=1 Tax=Lonsdalea populi TaxID=1172565 RepID=A0A3N0U5T0_9GAMM|nr:MULTISPECIES: molybdopterin-guanine dinucleotide biosynthesis protein MobB [Lonsdalea]OSN01346.1 molybdopterin-guanine dinucleotide biosynthesis protein MobB [Lonsdalea populi]QPQ24172.1 molybdopterin-guanine dinucleotide biosynthesis protein B [Lonsdalea populi]RAT12787.1 molybdopterin-guanine dinucleotide biosynthesis protein MobB [Lonsdalea quercina]RAT25109.1 molybdopterin-guanine dinucleotide biosynthesis protein MobB [Lonsdalea populi]RAT30683.1 molybdopterin-guanine dinucleotide bios
MTSTVPLLVVAAYSGTGKTTLLTQLIPLIQESGIRVGMIKHTHHEMDIDTPGKDSYRLRKAGAEQTLVASAKRWALMTETPDQSEPDIAWLAGRMDLTKLDLVLVEGFHHEKIPKIILYRQETGYNVADLIDENTLAIASDVPLNVSVPQLDLNYPPAIAAFICQWLEAQ